MRNEALSFLLLFLMLLFTLLNIEDNQESTPQESPPIQLTEVVETEVVQKVEVEYEIEYGSIYTGNQTPVIHRGTRAIPVYNDFGIGSNGLPISQWNPVSSRLTFDLHENEATLHIPTLSDRVIGLLKISGAFNATLMMVEVFRKDDDTFSIRAFPVLPGTT